MKSGSRLEKVLAADEFAVTAELGPPQNALQWGMSVERIRYPGHQSLHTLGIGLDQGEFAIQVHNDPG